MDVVSQALHVAAGTVGAARDRAVSVVFDLQDPAQRAAYAAAMAVLAALGDVGDAVVPGQMDATAPVPDPIEGALRRGYQSAMNELIGDPARAARAVADTYPVVREILLDGANVEAVAAIQYVRWTDDLRAVRGARG